MPHIESWNPSVEGPLSEQGLRDKLERKGYHVSRYVYPPGTYFPDHTHGVDKIDAVVSGRFRLTLEGEAVVLEAGDAIEVPRGAVHNAEVVGEEPVVSLDGVRE
jgi:quercetin dioxygenase-like cupin family protein